MLCDKNDLKRIGVTGDLLKDKPLNFWGEVLFYRLENQSYVESAASAAFPFLPGAVLTEFIEQSNVEGQDAAIEACREWALANKL